MNHHPAPDTQFVSTFDLRVVAGLHAGARIAIGESANDVLLVGHDAECDVVLQDPALAEGPLTIRLVRTDDGVVCGWQASRNGRTDRLDAWNSSSTSAVPNASETPDTPDTPSTSGAMHARDNPDAPAAQDTLETANGLGDSVALGEVVRWGGLGLTVAQQDAPWPSIDIMFEATLAGDAALASEAMLTRGTTDEDDVADANDPAKSLRRNVDDNGVPLDPDALLDGDNERPNGDQATSDDAARALDADADADADTNTTASAANADAPASLVPSGLAADLGANNTDPEDAKRIGARLRRVGSLIPAAVIAAIVSVVIVLLLGMLLIRILHGAGTSTAPVKVIPATANQNTAQVTKVIEKLGLSSALHLNITSDGLVAVTGWVRDDAQRDQLASALAQLTPMPAMLVGIETEAVSTAQQIVKPYGTYIDVVNQGGGHIHLIGLIDHAEARAQLESDFHSQLPTAALLDDRLLDREHMAEMLHSRLIDAGLRELTVDWSATGLQIGAKGHPMDGDKVYAVVQAFKQQYGMRLPIFAALDGTQEALAARALPFNISSITGGPLPSVVVDDGLSAGGRQTRLLPGGVYRGYRLLRITPQQVIFDGPQRVVVTR